MSEFVCIHLPEENLEDLLEVEKVDEIATALNEYHIDPAEMIYCGIEAMKLQSVTELPARAQTFGTSYSKWLREAELADKYGDGDVGDSPLYYAFLQQKPGVVAYDQAELTGGDLLWLPRNGNSISVAARALILFY